MAFITKTIFPIHDLLPSNRHAWRSKQEYAVGTFFYFNEILTLTSEGACQMYMLLSLQFCLTPWNICKIFIPLNLYQSSKCRRLQRYIYLL